MRAAQRMFGVVPTLRPVDIEVPRVEIDLVLPQGHEFSGAQPVTEHHENDRRIPHAMPSGFARRLDHGLHFIRSQIVAHSGAAFFLHGRYTETPRFKLCRKRTLASLL